MNNDSTKNLEQIEEAINAGLIKKYWSEVRPAMRPEQTEERSANPFADPEAFNLWCS